MSVPVLFGADRDRQPVFLPAPGNEITKSHDKHLLSGWILSIPAGTCRPPLAGGTKAAPAGRRRDQATSLAFSFASPIWRPSGAPPPISIRRGFIASGTTRRSSIESSPCSKLAARSDEHTSELQSP